MSKFIMLVGLPASGKSTLAEKLAKQENAVILSSDKLREELLGDVNNQDKNTSVFDEMNKKTKEYLESGVNVIYDATNINRKRRIHLINNEIKAEEKIVYYLNSHIMTSKYRDQARERTVGDSVIDKMYKNLHIPVENEGWNKVIYTEHSSKCLRKFRDGYENWITYGLSHDELFEKLATILPEFKQITNLPQDSSYHSFSVSRHTYHVYKYIFDNYHESDRLMMLWTALFHDLGKGFCKSFVNFKGEETKYANFIGHEYVSSQLASTILDLMEYDVEFIKQVSTLVQFHMMPMKASEKKMNEVKKLIEEDLFQRLLILSEADKNAK